ncbi:MAG: S-methyl-5-thioribose-1-phosphate isomerase, partial [Actinomycetota bacterium]|nr:S-methyl-5-thioribose-1-phosphate isomerase [Actinomycetota bacterium]
MAGHATTVTPALTWDGRSLRLLDQTLLPADEVWIGLDGAADTAAAIARLAVRGAPNIGIAAAYGLVMEIERAPGDDELRAAASVLREARPTAVNLAWAVDRVQTAALAVAPAQRAATARAEAEA